jgi:hypothetical protein
MGIVKNQGIKPQTLLDELCDHTYIEKRHRQQKFYAPKPLTKHFNCDQPVFWGKTDQQENSCRRFSSESVVRKKTIFLHFAERKNSFSSFKPWHPMLTIMIMVRRQFVGSADSSNFF